MIKRGFTLAEILITLTIIGAIAAITIPSLSNYVQDLQFKVLYKKAFSIASQATLKAYNEGTLLYITTPTGDPNSVPNFYSFEKQFTVIKECFTNNNSTCWDATGQKTWLDQGPANQQPRFDSLAFVDNSGMTWSKGFNTSITILVDTNGFKGPNIYGKDRWWFSPCSSPPNNQVGIPQTICVTSDRTIINNWDCPSGNCLYRSWLTN